MDRSQLLALSKPPAGVRYWPCGCRTDEGHDEERHVRNAELAANAQCWTLHEDAVEQQL